MAVTVEPSIGLEPSPQPSLSPSIGPSIGDLLAALDEDGRLAHLSTLPARSARYQTLDRPLPEELAPVFEPDGFWTHQAQAINLIRDRKSVVIATGTASGKSRCYQVPIAESAARRGDSGTALLLFPTKALAQDQLRALYNLKLPFLVPGTYDGDSTPEQRSWVRSTANAILTNPEMLHGSILPNHDRWSTFLRKLDHVVIDELHVLRGVFGTHVAHILRRLRRLCHHYGSDPTFVFTSATVGEPDELASTLCGKPVLAVQDDGSPQGERVLALVNPPLVNEAKGIRSSANAEAAGVGTQMIRAGHRTIVFCRSRRGAEVVTTDIDRRLPRSLKGTVRAYRAGYLTKERRQIEHELFDGTLKGVVATSALELGIDVGGLDAVVLNSFPGTISSFWQQIGRAGRDAGESIAVLVGGDDQLDQWFMRHPDDLLARTPERAVINPLNPFIVGPHLECAAFEKPISHDDAAYWGDALDDGIRDLVLGDTIALKPSGTGSPLAVYAGEGRPSRNIGLRGASNGEVRIARTDGSLVGTVDASRAPSLVHDGAVYLHQGHPYRVTALDLDAMVATVEDTDGGEYTQARSTTNITVVGADETSRIGDIMVSLGVVEVTTKVTGYQRREVRTRRILSNEVLDLPESTLRTRAFWYTLDTHIIEASGLEPCQVPGALHAAEHAGIGILPLFAICDRWDVGGVSTAWHAGAGGPAIFIYDAHPGGSGIAELGYREGRRHLEATLRSIADCTCKEGCPTCVQSPKCGNGNEPLDKSGATALLREILRRA